MWVGEENSCKDPSQDPYENYMIFNTFLFYNSKGSKQNKRTKEGDIITST